jgi:hypothetical protein
MTPRTQILGLRTLPLAATLAAALLAGCTVTTHSDDTVTNHCDVDTGVTCPSPSVGYTCTGDAQPTDRNSSLVCGDGELNNGDTSFCCSQPQAQAANSCEPDASITSCGSTAVAYTCTGAATPVSVDPALDCGSGVPGPNSTLSYCCNVTSSTTSSCNVDTTLTSCGDVSTGYRCTGGITPTDTDATLDCGDGVDGGDGTAAFCCIQFSSTTCMADSEVVGCTGGSYGFSCTSTATPDQEDPSLVCSDPIPGTDGKSLYCCSQ